MTPDRLRKRLRAGFLKILDATENLKPAPKDQKRPGTRASLRAFLADVDRGYNALASAREFSRKGISALERSDDLEVPLDYFFAATGILTFGVKKARKQGAFGPTNLRGRRAATATAEEVADQYLRLAEAYEAERATGKPRRTALIDARDRVPELRGLSYSVLEKALTEGRKLSKKL